MRVVIKDNVERMNRRGDRTIVNRRIILDKTYSGKAGGGVFLHERADINLFEGRNQVMQIFGWRHAVGDVIRNVLPSGFNYLQNLRIMVFREPEKFVRSRHSQLSRLSRRSKQNNSLGRTAVSLARAEPWGSYPGPPS